MVRLLARVVGIGTETADMLVNEVLSRPLRDRRAVARYAGLAPATASLMSLELGHEGFWRKPAPNVAIRIRYRCPRPGSMWRAARVASTGAATEARTTADTRTADLERTDRLAAVGAGRWRKVREPVTAG